MRRDEGALSLFVAVCALTLLALSGLVLDGGGRLLAIERADAVAQEAARAGGQQIDRGRLLAGQGYVLDHGAATSAVHTYLDLVGNTQDVTTEVTDTTVSVHLTSTYHTLLLGLIGIGTLDVQGSGSAQVVHGVTAPRGN
ncbi:hypothetical protein [Streptacidiphilus monticola]|uniref:Flp pilus-assembly TadG-like N-terminal domain-containing protein n=1 Tax=Streptacidiphilus monticola TaxID=2161674 RepID=A0ABW1G888_9ACTN